MSDSFDFSDLIDNSSDKNIKPKKRTKPYKTITTSQFILVLLFIFLAMVVGICVQNQWFR